MSHITTPAVVLRSIEYGDYDLIITFLTLEQGKVAALAKNGRKSTRRFGGALELFSLVNIVYAFGRKKGGLPVLSESSLDSHFGGIRMDIAKTALASFWAETIFSWAEELHAQERLFHLLVHVLGMLDAGQANNEEINIFFIMRFLGISGLSPNLTQCYACNRSLDELGSGRISFDHARGGIVCPNCAPPEKPGPMLSVGTIKQLLWLSKGDLATAGRVRLSSEAVTQGAALLESFLPHHLGREPKSLRFLQDLRRRQAV